MVYVRWVPKNEIHRKASDFLSEHHPELLLPVPVDLIAEFGLNLHLIPAGRLHSLRGIDGFLSSDRTTIYLEENLFAGSDNRFRFTIAHELGHFVLHEDTWEEFHCDDDFHRFREGLTENGLDYAEWQADEFAGQLLVPPRVLSEVAPAVFRSVLSTAREGGFEGAPTGEFLWSIVARRVGETFGVSRETARIRLLRDGFWQQDLTNS